MFKRCYFDYNASVPMVEEAYKVLVDNLNIYGNPSSVHKEGLAAKKILENARTKIAKALNIKQHNLVFTSGASEAATTLLTQHYFIGRSPCFMSHLYIGATEHPSILEGGGFNSKNISKIPVLKNGIINYSVLENYLKKHDLSIGLPLVAIQAANSETGVLQDIESIAKIVHLYKGLLIVDIAQLLGKVTADLNKMDGDFYIISAHKLGGPKNIGAFVACSDIIAPQSLIKGSQERGRRGGTQAAALCASFAVALCKSLEKTPYTNIEQLRNYLESQLYKLVPDIIFYGKETKRLPNTSFFRIPNIEAQTLQMALDLEGFAVSAGSACSSGKVNSSHVLQAMGEEEGINAIRVSLGAIHSKENIDSFIEKLSIIIKRS